MPYGAPMPQPYRVLGPSAAAGDPPAVRPRDPEARAIYVVLAVLGVARLAAALALGEAFGAESTVALAMVVAAAWGAFSR